MSAELTTPIKIKIPGIGTIESADLYLKYEADKLIDHQKYKRCIAMAEWCESEENRLEAISPIFDTDKECWEYNSDYWYRWRERWLKLAEKFKERKNAED